MTGRRLTALCAFALLCSAPFVASQDSTALPSTWPHVYPGQPSGGYSPKWQSCSCFPVARRIRDTQCLFSDFQVTAKLPNITWNIERSFAGNLPVQREGHPNNTLFFLGFEKSTGSLTGPANPRNQEPWGIWLNGG